MQSATHVHKKTWSRQLLLLVVLLCFFLLLDLSIGSVSIPVSAIFDDLLGNDIKGSWHQILINFRLPKAITAIMVGMGLGVTGMHMQTFFRNPLAGPFVLGISSGASLGVALLIMAGTAFGFAQSAGLTALAAAIGASAVMILVVITAIRLRDNMSLLIVGLMFGSATGAIVSILQFFSQAESIQSYLSWTFGSLGTVTWDKMLVFLPVISIGLIASIALLKPLNMLLLGENYAMSMGINIKRTRLLIIVVASLLAGTITAFCGPIAFIGVALPHLTRMIFNTSDHRYLFPLLLLLGAIVMLICDLIAQLPGSEHTLPINAVTAILGAPVVIWIIVSRGNLKRFF